MQECNIAVIGAGSMGTAIIESQLNRGHENLIATKRNKAHVLTEEYGIEATTDNQYAVQGSELALLTVRPRHLDDICRTIIPDSDTLFLSLAAGKSLDGVKQSLGTSKVGRVMTGIHIDDEVAWYTLNHETKTHDREMVQYVFGEDATSVEEQHLSKRAWLGCLTGILAAEAEELASSENYTQQDALETVWQEYKDRELETVSKDLKGIVENTLYGMRQGVRRAFQNGLNGLEILHAVGGPGSYTEEIYSELQNGGAESYDALRERTLNACRVE